jgi:hypothetical protein
MELYFNILFPPTRWSFKYLPFLLLIYNFLKKFSSPARSVRLTHLIIIDLINLIIFIEGQIPVAVRSKAWVCDGTFAGITGSNPARGMNVSFECYVLSGRGLCDGVITCPEEFYRLWCVVVCSWCIDNGEAAAQCGTSSHWKETNEISKYAHKIFVLLFLQS